MVWIEKAETLVIHDMQVAEHGGLAGVRDYGLLESALARPLHMEAYGDPPASLTRLAAAYAWGITRNHPFVDGNKRTALVVALTFLELNGIEITAAQEETYLTFLRLAEGSLSEEELAAWLEAHGVPL